MSFHRVIAFDLGPAHLAGGVFETGDAGRLQLRRVAFQAREAGGPGDESFAALATFVREFAAGEKPGTEAAFALAGPHNLLKFIRVPAAEPAARDELIREEAARLLPGSLEEIVWDHAVLADDGGESECLLAAARRDAVMGVRNATVAARLSLRGVTPPALALLAGFRLNHPEAASGVIVVDPGARSTTLLFIDAGRISARTCAVGSDEVNPTDPRLAVENPPAGEISDGVRPKASDRSVLPREGALASTAEGDFLHRLHSEIVRSSLSHRRRTGAAAPSVLFLAGNAAKWPELPGRLRERLQVRVERYDPLRLVETDAEVCDAVEPFRERLGNLVGLVAPLLPGGAVTPAISLLPPTESRAADARLRERVAVALAAGSLAALLAPIGYFHHRAAQLQDETQRLSADVASLRALDVRQGKKLEALAASQSQIVALDRAVAQKSSWAAFLDDLQTRLADVGDVWLDQLSILPAAAAETRSTAETRTSKTPVAPPVRLSVSGRLLNRAEPAAKGGPEAVAKVKRLVASLADSAFVAAVEQEKFDPTQAGLLRFDLTLVLRPSAPL